MVNCSRIGSDLQSVMKTSGKDLVSCLCLRLLSVMHQRTCRLGVNDMARECDMTPQGCMLRWADQQTVKRCDPDEGGCGRDLPLLTSLEGPPPAAFSLQIAWATPSDSRANICATFDAIQEVQGLSM